MHIINFLAIPQTITMPIYLTIKQFQFQLLNVSKDIAKNILSYSNTIEAAGLDQFSAIFLKKAADVLAYH